VAENVCRVCKETFRTESGRPPDPPIFEDCQLKNWNGEAEDERPWNGPERNGHGRRQ